MGDLDPDGAWAETPPGEDQAELEAAAISEEVAGVFRTLWSERVSFDEDRALGTELSTEARPAADALRLALTLHTQDDETSLEHHEGLAMIHLLGRRAATLGATPSALTCLVPTLADALRETGEARSLELVLSEAMRLRLTATCWEGYVRGREERTEQVLRTRAATAMPTLELAPGCVALILAGAHEPAVLVERARVFGRTMFAAEAKACVVDISRLFDPHRSRAAAILEVASAATLMGASHHVSGVTDAVDGWGPVLRELGVDEARLHASFEGALAAAIKAAGLRLQPRMDAVLRRLLGG